MGRETRGIEVKGYIIVRGKVGGVDVINLGSEVGGVDGTTLGYTTGYEKAMEYLH